MFDARAYYMYVIKIALILWELFKVSVSASSAWNTITTHSYGLESTKDHVECNQILKSKACMTM